MIHLNREQLNELIEHSRKESPNEACGILAGRDKIVKRIYTMTNTDKSAKTFFMDPKEQLKVMKEMRNEGLEMLGIYHSHLESEAYPSGHDVETAFYPEVSYLIVSIKDKASPRIRSFKIVKGKINEEEIRIE